MPVFFVIVAELLVFAAGFLPVFLFCAANADVPASASAKAPLIRILFIILLRWIFLTTDSINSLVLIQSGRVDFCKCKERAGSSKAPLFR